MADNPLLDWLNAPLPPFDRIDPVRDGPTALQAVLRAADEALVQAETANTLDWERLMQPVEMAEERIERAWKPVRLLAAVQDKPTLRKVHEDGEAMLAAWHARALQQTHLFAKLQQMPADRLSPSRREARNKRLLAMKKAGAALASNKKARIAEIEQRLASLGARFEQNLRDAERAFQLVLTEEEASGLPQTLRLLAQARAKEEGIKGLLFDASPSMAAPFLTHTKNRALRQKMHRAYQTRASTPPFDNTPLMLEILALRDELARSLGYESFAEYALDGRMCASVETLKDFLHQMVMHIRPKAEEELATLESFARRNLSIDRLQPEDLAFASEQLRKAELGLDAEALRAFFPAAYVVAQALSLAEETFMLSFVEDEAAPRWHQEVRAFRVHDAKTNAPIGWLYLDLAARSDKRSGAWMDELVTRWRRPDGARQLPVACVVADFAAPRVEGQLLWTHENVCTLLHELGHALHHLLAEIDDARDVSGLNGVEWDAVELPSQWFEQLGWSRYGLRRLSQHLTRHTPLDDATIAKLQRQRSLLAAMRLARQLEFSLLDLVLHEGRPPKDETELRQRVQKARNTAGVAPRASYDRFENSFAHIFAGGYAAGYYGYLWAEALAAEAWQHTHPNGVFDPAACQRFRQEILAFGGARAMSTSFAAFTGHSTPAINALLALYGLD